MVLKIEFRTTAFRLFVVVCSLWLTLAVRPAAALDLTGGVMYAVPTIDGHPPAIDGKLGDWDLSGAEPIWAANQTASIMHASVAAEYDSDAIYLCAIVTLPNRAMRDANGPKDRFWGGDMMEFRLCSDPSLPYPLNGSPEVAASRQVCHCSVWQDTDDGKNYLDIQYGAGFNYGRSLNPSGSQVAVVTTTAGYIIQAKIPWTALNVPGGKNPFGTGQRMTATLSVHWGFDYQIPMLFNRDPGGFAFMHPDTWGQMVFSPTGHLKPHHETMAESVEASKPKPVGVPITVDVPEAGKISVNIIGPDGEVVRELCGGVPVTPGKFTTAWDGFDQWGFPMPPGTYRWGAYISGGLTPKFLGEVGSSGTPATNTLDGTGGWGGDHGYPIGVAADASGIYFAWQIAEAQMFTLKMDYSGKTLWRKSPFVNGGFDVIESIASNGKYLFVVWDGVHPLLSRQNVQTGALIPYDTPAGSGSSPLGDAGRGSVAAVPIATGAPVVAPAAGFPNGNGDGTAPNCEGVAASATEVYVSDYPDNQIQVFDPETGARIRTMACPRPRGLALDKAGDLFAVCYGTDQPGKVVEFTGAQGAAKDVVTTGLVAPFGVAVDSAGRLHVTDLGSSQQVKTFAPDDALAGAIGRPGGRAISGAYDRSSFLNPTEIVADAQGGIDLAETSLPKVFDRLDASTGAILHQWYGWPAYGVSNIPDSDDPLTSYYPFEPFGFARGTLPAVGGQGVPDAYWDLQGSGVQGVGELFDANSVPYVKVLANHRKYFIDDDNPHGVCLIEGDKMVPVGHLMLWNWNLPGNPRRANYIEAWIDRDGDHKVEPGEIATCDAIQGQPVYADSGGTGSMWLDVNGDAFFSSWNNEIIEIPSDGFLPDGAIEWNLAKAHVVVPVMVPSLVDGFASPARAGVGGIRVDDKGDVFICLTLEIPGLTPDLANRIAAKYPDIPQSKWCVYATPDLAKQMHVGLGHTSESTAVKFAEYGPDGKLKWIAGRKAVAAPGPGEMYHFWDLAGMVGNDYVAATSEWGPMYFYTSDGFYVDSIMNDPNQLAPPGPYTFGSETFGGRVEAFPKLGAVYAYNQGGIYRVQGFDSGLHVIGEKREYGSVTIEKTYLPAAPAQQNAAPIQLVPLANAMTDPNAWSPAPVSTIVRAGATLATVALGYDDTYVYARYHVDGHAPVNVSDDVRLAFKGGDSVALDLGPAGDRDAPAAGDVRILAALVDGKPKLIGMKPVTGQAKAPNEYTTPAGGTKRFEFVGEVPGGQVSISPDADGKGYTALFAVPRAFLEVPITPGATIKGDVEVLLSGQGSRGLQTISRNPLFAAGHAQAIMVDDTPTESWLYPRFWGDVVVK